MTTKEKILVVDDDPNIRRTLSDILRIKGYDVVVAGTGAEAVTAAEHQEFGVALIDLMLPDLQGIEVMSRIKAISPLTEAIILTGHASLETAVDATRMGAFSYLLKPYKIEELLENIGRAIERKQAQSKIIQQATTDSLTGAANRREFDRMLENEIARSKRYHTHLSLIMYDLDNFKRVNDACGHDVGDMVLKDMTELVKNSIRTSDTVARWGGEEFMVLAPQLEIMEAARMAERLRLAIESHSFGRAGTVTVSFGVVALEQGDDAGTLQRRVDEALYQAKRNGRNRVEVLAGASGDRRQAE